MRCFAVEQIERVLGAQLAGTNVAAKSSMKACKGLYKKLLRLRKHTKVEELKSSSGSTRTLMIRPSYPRLSGSTSHHIAGATTVCALQSILFANDPGNVLCKANKKSKASPDATKRSRKLKGYDQCSKRIQSDRISAVWDQICALSGVHSNSQNLVAFAQATIDFVVSKVNELDDSQNIQIIRSISANESTSAYKGDAMSKMKLNYFHIDIKFSYRAINEALNLVRSNMSKRSYDDYRSMQHVKFPTFRFVWELMERIDVGRINIPIGIFGGVNQASDRARKVDIRDTIQRTLDHEVYGSLLNKGFSSFGKGKGYLDITVTGDGAAFSETKGVVSISIAFNAFRSRKHCPMFNIPVAFGCTDESATNLRRIFYSTYKELNDLDNTIWKSKWIQHDLLLRVWHCNDLKFITILTGSIS